MQSSLPVFINIVTNLKDIESVELSLHTAGFSYQILGAGCSELRHSIQLFIERYLRGESFPLPPLNLKFITPFTLEVISYLQTIPFGSTKSYSDVAYALKRPKAFCAVGSACGRNPFPFFLPCHRVLGKQGLGGFSGGIDIKKELLTFEQSRLVLA